MCGIARRDKKAGSSLLKASCGADQSRERVRTLSQDGLGSIWYFGVIVNQDVEMVLIALRRSVPQDATKEVQCSCRAHSSDDADSPLIHTRPSFCHERLSTTRSLYDKWMALPVKAAVRQLRSCSLLQLCEVYLTKYIVYGILILLRQNG